MDTVFSQNVCRLCMWPRFLCYQIFNDDEEESVLSTRIWALLQIVVSQEDALPKVICYYCLYKLQMFDMFQANCVKCDSTMKSYIVPANIHTTDPVNATHVQVAPVVEQEQQLVTEKVEIIDLEIDTDEELESTTNITSDLHNMRHEEPSSSTTHVEAYTAPQQTFTSAMAQILQEWEQEPQSSVTRCQSTVKEHHVAETDSVLKSSKLDSRTTTMQECTSSAQVMSEEASVSGIVSSSGIDLRKHYVCKPCNREFKNSYNLNKHDTCKHSQKNFICEYCDKTFSHLQVLTSHKAIHLKNKYYCQICSKEFNSSFGLKYHVEHECVTAAISNDHRYARRAAPSEMEEEVGQGSFNQANFFQNVMKTEVAGPGTTVDINKEETHCDLCELDFKNRHGLRCHKGSQYHINREALAEKLKKRKVALKGTEKTKLHQLVTNNTAQSSSKFRMSRIKKAKEFCKIRAERALKAQITKQNLFKHKHINTPCDICGKDFASLMGMRIHHTKTHGKKNA